MNEDVFFLIHTILVAQGSTDKRLNKKTGAIIVKDSKIIGTGNRKTMILQKNPYKDITYHAEHMALMEARENAKGATLYTALEPCASRSLSAINAWEPSPPCCQLIFESGISRVVYACPDHNFGKGGGEYLKQKGIEVNVLIIPDHILKFMDNAFVPNPTIIDESITFNKPL